MERTLQEWADFTGLPTRMINGDTAVVLSTDKSLISFIIPNAFWLNEDSEPAEVSFMQNRYRDFQEAIPLRDYYAGQALQKLPLRFYSDTYNQMFDNWQDRIAKDAYVLADAMMKARGK